MAWAAAAAAASFRPPTLSLPHCNLRKTCRVRNVQLVRSRVRVVAAQQSDVVKALGTFLKISKDVLDTGSKLVPESVPRPVARVGVAIGSFVVISLVLKSFLSTAFFILVSAVSDLNHLTATFAFDSFVNPLILIGGVIGVIYLAFIYLNKDEGPRRSIEEEDGTIDESLEEARRIMDKYK